MRLARVQSIAEVHQPDAEPPGERRADGFLVNRRADVVGVGLVLFQRRLGLVEFGLRNRVVRAQFPRALRVEPSPVPPAPPPRAIAPPRTTCPASPANRPSPPRRRIQKAISVTVPATSGATVTPCAALIEPTAVRVSGHCSSRATADEMVSGGGASGRGAPMSVVDLQRLDPRQTAARHDHDDDADE